jgi:hypothetical protein
VTSGGSSTGPLRREYGPREWALAQEHHRGRRRVSEFAIARGDHSGPHRCKTAADIDIAGTAKFNCFDYEYAWMLRPLAAALPCHGGAPP